MKNFLYAITYNSNQALCCYRCSGSYNGRSYRSSSQCNVDNWTNSVNLALLRYMVSAPSYRPTPAMAILLKLWMLAWGLSLASAILTCGTCESGASSLTCPDSFNMQYTVNLYPSDGELDKSLHLKCDYFTPKLNFTWLQGCSFPTVIYVKIEQCPLFDESIASVLEKIGVAPANVKHLVWETSLPAEAGPHSWHLERLGNLTSLQIHRNEFTSLPDSFLQTTPLLEKLYITGNSLGELPSDLLTYSPNITTLDIGNNKLTSVPENLLQNVPSLQIFNIWTNELTSIPPRLFANLPQLHTIGLSENSLTSLDSQLFSNMKKLHTLDIRINQLESLPNSLFEGCSNLTSVSLQFNKIPSLPPSLFQGTAIKFLHIGYNELANITTTLQNLPTLENVTLHKNHILGLEADLFQGSPNIVQLDLQANAIQFLADGVLDNLSKLKVFLINNNYLEELPPALFRDCISLLRVFMQNNHLTTIPADTFPEHSSIVKLDLSDNQLTLLADGFFHPLNKLTNIEELYLANNLVSYIFTDALHLFTRLRVLNLKNNNLTSLTDHDLDFISKNVTLYLQDNQITNISTTIYLGIGSIDEIISIYLEGNPLNCNCQMHSFLKAAQFTPPFTYNRPYNLIVADARQSMCAEPETYEGTSLDNVDASKVLCSYDCSPECSCDIRLDDKYVLIDCSDRELFEAPSFIDSFVDDTKLFKLSLDLSNNAYENVSFLSDPDLHNLVNVDLSNNSLSELNETYLPATLQFIDLRFNNFSAMPGALVEYFNSTAMTLLLGDNPWTCDCELKSFHEFLRNNYELVSHFITEVF